MADDKPYGEYGCFVDDCDGDTCVFDGFIDDDPRSVHNCDVASALIGDGKGRNDCPHGKRVSEEDPYSALRARVAKLEDALKTISTLYWKDAPAPEEMRNIARRALEEK